jgi:D-alanyl-D-alanine carboxypeptidase (penicillin-binding protein 5/6)
MKKLISLALIALLLFASLPFAEKAASADSFDQSQIYEPYYILVNAETPSKSYRGIEQDADKQVYPASTTKILTCIVALERGNLDDMVSVSAKAVDFGRGNSLMGLEQGDQYTLRDMLYGMMLPSGNDAAIAIAEHIAGSTEAYAELMNEKAKEIGMTHSHFVTVHGKQNENHYTTVRDMAVLTAYALNTSPKCEEFRSIVGTGKYTASSGPRAIELINSNRMIYDTPASEDLPNPISCLYPDAIGVKTGDTNAAGKCLIAAAERDGVTLIAVLYGGTLGDPDYNDGWKPAQKDKYNVRRFKDAAALFDYAYSDMIRTVSVSELIAAGLPVEFDITIANAAADDSQGGVLKVRADLSPDTQLSVMQPDPNATIADLSIETNPTYSNMYAPIGEGAVIGSVTYTYHGKTLTYANLIATRSVKEGTAQTEVVTAPVDPTGEDVTPQTTLIGEPNTPSLDPDAVPVTESAGGCGLPDNMHWVPIVLVIFLVLLIVCVVLFILYMRAEQKRRRAAARRRARERARQSGDYYNRRS